MEKILALTISLVLFVSWETIRPFYAFGKGHTLRMLNNAAVGLTNALLGRLLFAAVYAWLFSFIQARTFGLLYLLPASPVARMAAGLLIMDCWTYWWHRFNHTIPFLWRFHRAHHTDTEMCALTAYRFHPVEIVLSSILRLPLFLLAGIPAQVIIVYESVLAVSVAFHHANLGVGKRLDALLRIGIVSPIMHKLHHSTKPDEFSSNYSSILSIWDRIFRTSTETAQAESIKLGLNIYRDSWWQSYPGILLTPFRGSNSRKA